jgi:hypothetical protein
MNNPTISQVTKCVKRNKQNIKIQLNELDEFTQGTEFIIYREKTGDQNEQIKTISSNILNDTSSIITYNLNEIIDIPNKLDDIFENELGSNYYLYGINKLNSFITSLLYIISKDFKLKSKDKQEQFSNELIILLLKELPTYHKNNKYTALGYRLSDIENGLQNNTINSGVLRYISDYYNINIIILDYNKEKYIIGKEYNDSLNEKNVIIILNEGIYLPLVNMFGEFPSKLLYKCIVNKVTIDKSNTISVDSVKILDESNKKNTLKLKAISSYKLTDLQEIATENNVILTENIDGKSKNKTKQKLYNELILI